MTKDQPPDLLHGHAAIAAFLGLTVRQAKHWAHEKRIPTFKLPGDKTVCARRSTLTAWLDEQEAKARAGQTNTEVPPEPGPAG